MWTIWRCVRLSGGADMYPRVLKQLDHVAVRGSVRWVQADRRSGSEADNIYNQCQCNSFSSYQQLQHACPRPRSSTVGLHSVGLPTTTARHNMVVSSMPNFASVCSGTRYKKGHGKRNGESVLVNFRRDLNTLAASGGRSNRFSLIGSKCSESYQINAKYFHVLLRNSHLAEKHEKDDLAKHFAEDPDVKSLLSEINEDFQAELKQPESENPDSSSSDNDSSSESDSDSSSSDSDTDTEKQPDESKIESDKTPTMTAGSPGTSNMSLSQTAVRQTSEDYEYEDFYAEVEDEEFDIPEDTLPITMERGRTGVFDVDELVTLLTEEKGDNICVIDIPAERKFVEHMVIVTGRSTRHLKAMAALIRWTFKRKRGKADPVTVNIEGEHCLDWVAMDLGNIVVHLFLVDTREKYDLETLWTIGDDPSHEELGSEEDPFALYIDQNFSIDTRDQSEVVRSDNSDVTGQSNNSSETDGQQDTKSLGSCTDNPRNTSQGMESLGGWHSGRRL